MSRKTKNDDRFRVLVVDDHASAREAVADVLREAQYFVATCASASEALPKLSGERFDVVVTDLQMPGMSGLEFICEIERRRIDVQVLMITAHASVSSAVEAMRHGACDYIEKPFDAIALERSVAQACDRRLATHDSVADAMPGNANSATMMIGSSPAMQQLRERIAQVAKTDETVLICGESGTGKELVARAIHSHSRRSSGPMVSLNCPALSAQLTESELFGHKRGAFTGAEADRTGRFEAAHGGSILLDEITEIDLGLQAKLLRVLQERSFERVGASETVAVDVRVIATTNRDLLAEISAGRFREDLYFRLAVVPIVLPPLRERESDVLELADHFLALAAERLGRPLVSLETAARTLLNSYNWPGNVRELQNIITRACVLNQGAPIAAVELRPWLRDSGVSETIASPEASEVASIPDEITLDEMERRLIVATLKRCDGHRAKAAEKLGIGLRTLSGKLRAYGYAPREKDFASTE
ncbi:MAG TPA: sigma-54 dependent transcriptional regulator [Lacipirellulaceae bacterium]|jgi:DNA-binding NtrC family response regulator|nr:sigma-54 dependent transcriptional regulator [Lacipirellulaceae bacterium]